MLLMPTSSTLLPTLRHPINAGRYMSIYGLTWGAAAGMAPLLGGFLNDTFGPQTIWFGGGVAGLFGPCGFVFLFQKERTQQEA